MDSKLIESSFDRNNSPTNCIFCRKNEPVAMGVFLDELHNVFVCYHCYPKLGYFAGMIVGRWSGHFMPSGELSEAKYKVAAEFGAGLANGVQVQIDEHAKEYEELWDSLGEKVSKAFFDGTSAMSKSYQENPIYKQSNTPGWVYLMSRADGLYKIGLSKQVQTRLKQLAPDNPGLKLVHLISSDNSPEAESILHQRYGEFRVKGEWFSLLPDHILEIQSIAHFEKGKFFLHGEMMPLATEASDDNDQ